MINFDYKKEDGIALLFTIAIVSIVSIMIASMARINFRQNLVTFSFSESAQAFFAADSGMSCFERNAFVDQTKNCGGTIMAFKKDNGVFSAKAELIPKLCTIIIVDGNKAHSFGYNRTCDEIEEAFTSTEPKPHLQRLIQERSISFPGSVPVPLTPSM